LQQMTESSSGPCAKSKLFLPHSAQARSMRIGLGVLRIERRHKSALLPKLAFNGQLQLLGLVDRIAIAVRIDIVRFGKSAFVIEAVQSIIAHAPLAIESLARHSLRIRFPESRTYVANVPFHPKSPRQPSTHCGLKQIDYTADCDGPVGPFWVLLVSALEKKGSSQ